MAELSTIDSVAIAQQISWGGVGGEGLHDLVCGPGGGGMLGHIEMEDAPAAMSEDHEDKEHTERGRWNGEEVDRHESAEVIVQEGAPGLGWGLALPFRHQCGHGALAYVDAELEQLAMNARRAPQGVGLGHLADEFADGGVRARTPERCPGAPGPELAEGGAMPTHDGVRFDEDEDMAPTGPHKRERYPEEAVGPEEGRARSATLENDQLLAEREVLQGQRGAGTEGRPGGGNDGEKKREHGQSVYPLAAMGKRLETARYHGRSSFANHRLAAVCYRGR